MDRKWSRVVKRKESDGMTKHKGGIWRLQGANVRIEYDFIVHPRWKNVLAYQDIKSA